MFSILAKGRSPFHLSALEATFIKTSNPILCRQKEFVYNLKILHVSAELWTYCMQLRCHAHWLSTNHSSAPSINTRPFLCSPFWRSFLISVRRKNAHGGGRVVSASGSETSVWSSMPPSAIIYDAYTSIKKLKKYKKRKECLVLFKCSYV